MKHRLHVTSFCTQQISFFRPKIPVLVLAVQVKRLKKCTFDCYNLAKQKKRVKYDTLFISSRSNASKYFFVDFHRKKITFFCLRFLRFPFKSHYLRLQEVLTILILITIKVSQVLSALTLPFNILSKNIDIACNIRDKYRNRVWCLYLDNQAMSGSCLT